MIETNVIPFPSNGTEVENHIFERVNRATVALMEGEPPSRLRWARSFAFRLMLCLNGNLKNVPGWSDICTSFSKSLSFRI